MKDREVSGKVCSIIGRADLLSEAKDRHLIGEIGMPLVTEVVQDGWQVRPPAGEAHSPNPFSEPPCPLRRLLRPVLTDVSIRRVRREEGGKVRPLVSVSEDGTPRDRILHHSVEDGANDKRKVEPLRQTGAPHQVGVGVSEKSVCVVLSCERQHRFVIVEEVKHGWWDGKQEGADNGKEGLNAGGRRHI